jgi:hypothetical protein
VTTLIEVLFKNSDIVDEEEPAPGKRVPVDPAKVEPAVKDA